MTMLYGLKEEVIKKIQECLKKYASIDEAILYGSRAMGNFNRGSDIDLALKGKYLTLSDLFKIENDIDDLMLWYKIDISLYEQINNPDLIEHIKRVGKSFYKRGQSSYTDRVR